MFLFSASSGKTPAWARNRTGPCRTRGGDDLYPAANKRGFAAASFPTLSSRSATGAPLFEFFISTPTALRPSGRGDRYGAGTLTAEALVHRIFRVTSYRPGSAAGA